MTADRVKLITEWATWRDLEGGLRLYGAVDHVALITRNSDGGWDCCVYADAEMDTSAEYAGWRYYPVGSNADFDVDDVVEMAKAVCVDRLLAAGLIDPFWWLAQEETK